MQKLLYSVRDSKAQIFNSPFEAHTHGEAERSFQSAVLDPQTSINKYPEDFDLYHLGTIDTETGKISALDTPQHMIKASNLKAQ